MINSPPQPVAPAVAGDLFEAFGERTRVVIQHGGKAYSAIGRSQSIVVPAGAEVVKTDNVPGFGQSASRVVYYRDGNRAAAAALLQALGAGVLRQEGRDIGVFDITIIVGADFKSPPGT